MSYFVDKSAAKQQCGLARHRIVLGLLSVGLAVLSPSVHAFQTPDVTYEYDDLGRLKKVTYENDSKDVGYYYDAAGNRQAVVVAAEGQLPATAPTAPVMVVVPLLGLSGVVAK